MEFVRLVKLNLKKIKIIIIIHVIIIFLIIELKKFDKDTILINGSLNGNIKVTNLNTSKQLKEFKGHKSSVWVIF
jgi:hypothetical protein